MLASLCHAGYVWCPSQTLNLHFHGFALHFTESSQNPHGAVLLLEGQGVTGLSGEKARHVLWLTQFWYCQERMSHLNAFAHRRIHCRIAFVRRRKAWMPSP